jgi:hypothetical protein
MRRRRLDKGCEACRNPAARAVRTPCNRMTSAAPKSARSRPRRTTAVPRRRGADPCRRPRPPAGAGRPGRRPRRRSGCGRSVLEVSDGIGSAARRETEDVRPAAAGQAVVARAADQQVAAELARERVVARSAGQPVALRPAAQVVAAVCIEGIAVNPCGAGKSRRPLLPPAPPDRRRPRRRRRCQLPLTTPPVRSRHIRRPPKPPLRVGGRGATLAARRASDRRHCTRMERTQ